MVMKRSPGCSCTCVVPDCYCVPVSVTLSGGGSCCDEFAGTYTLVEYASCRYYAFLVLDEPADCKTGNCQKTSYYIWPAQVTIYVDATVNPVTCTVIFYYSEYDEECVLIGRITPPTLVNYYNGTCSNEHSSTGSDYTEALGVTPCAPIVTLSDV